MLRRVRQAAFVLTLVLMGCAVRQPQQGSVVLEHLWSVSPGFQSAESVIYDADRDRLYVSNVNGYTKNGEGYLSRLSLDGEVLDHYWIDGLNGPTGMAIWQDTLYVADMDVVVAVNLNTARIEQRYPAPDASPGLNDITINPDGRLFVSGSFSRTIYELTAEGLQIRWVSDKFQDANGLYADRQNVILAGYWLHVTALADGQPALLNEAEWLIDLESIETDGRGGYFVTAIGARPLWHLTGADEPQAVLQPDRFFSDIDYIVEKQMLLIPAGGDSLSAYRVTFP